MLTLLRLPFQPVSRPAGGLRWRSAHTLLFSIEELWGSAPRARQGEAPAKCRRRLGPSPRSSALPHVLNLYGQPFACADPLFERRLAGGRSPPLGPPWHLLPPVSPTGRGAGAGARLAPRKAGRVKRTLSGSASEASVPLLTDDSQIGANLRFCADEENRANFDQRG
jgi:hypothetical protein